MLSSTGIGGASVDIIPPTELRPGETVEVTLADVQLDEPFTLAAAGHYHGVITSTSGSCWTGWFWNSPLS